MKPREVAEWDADHAPVPNKPERYWYVVDTTNKRVLGIGIDLTQAQTNFMATLLEMFPKQSVKHMFIDNSMGIVVDNVFQFHYRPMSAPDYVVWAEENA